MGVVTTVVSFVLVLGVLVFFHELGHYLAARRSGIVVEEFGMGYPPRLAKLFTYKGTLFTLNALPFGGYARMKGEDAGDMSPGSFNAASAGARAFTLLAGPAMNLVLAIILFASSLMVGGAEVLLGYPQVREAGAAEASAIGLLPGDVLLRADGTPTQVNAIPESRVSTTWEADASGAVMLEVLRDGQTMTMAGADTAGVERFLEAQGAWVPVMSTRIEATAPSSPAETGGIQVGDLVYAVDGTVVTLDSPLAEAVGQRLGEEMSLGLLRETELVEVALVPRVNPPAGEGALGVQIGPVAEFTSMPVLQSVWQGVTDTFRYIGLVLQLPVQLILGTAAPGAAQVSGPVGIAREVGGAVNSSIDYGVFWPILRLSAVLSAALAITNLLPLPALDGGRLLFIVIEKLRGKRVNPEREGMVHVIGFMLLLSLMVLITVRDIASPHQTIDWSLILGQ